MKDEAMDRESEVERRIVGPDGSTPKVLVRGLPCPFCGAPPERVKGCFGGGAVCMTCGAMSKDGDS